MAKPKFPLLEQMRAQRAERNREYETAIWEMNQNVHIAFEAARQHRRQKEALERVFARDLSKDIREKIAYGLSHQIKQAVFDAVREARGERHFYAEVKVPVDLQLHPDMKSVESMVLKYYLENYRLLAEVKSRRMAKIPQINEIIGGQDCIATYTVDVLDIRIPAFGCQPVISDMHPPTIRRQPHLERPDHD